MATLVSATVGAGDAARVHIASEGGTQVWRVGGLANDAPASHENIRQTGQIVIGRNSTCLAYANNMGWNNSPTMTSQLIDVCGGDREIDWITFSVRIR